VRVPDKSSGVLCSGASVADKYKFIDAEYAAAAADKATAPTIRQMCEWLEVSRSGFYEWRYNPGSAAAERREELKLIITKAFEDSDGTSGYRRVHAQLQRWGVRCGDELVRALMRELGLVPCQVRRRRSLTAQAAAGPIPDLVNRDFEAAAPGEKMVGDITYIFTWAGWLYLATVIDCATRKVIGWAMDDNYRTPLITAAIEMAARNLDLPEGKYSEILWTGALVSTRGRGAATRWRVVRDLRVLRVFAVLRGGWGWRCPGCGGC